MGKPRFKFLHRHKASVPDLHLLFSLSFMLTQHHKVVVRIKWKKSFLTGLDKNPIEIIREDNFYFIFMFIIVHLFH